MSDLEKSFDENEQFEEVSISDGLDDKEITIDYSGGLESSTQNQGLSPGKRSGSIIKKQGESVLSESQGRTKTVSFDAKVEDSSASKKESPLKLEDLQDKPVASTKGNSDLNHMLGRYMTKETEQAKPKEAEDKKVKRLSPKSAKPEASKKKEITAKQSKTKSVAQRNMETCQYFNRGLESKEIYLKSDLNKMKRGVEKKSTGFDKYNSVFLHEMTSPRERMVKVRPSSGQVRRGYTLTRELIKRLPKVRYVGSYECPQCDKCGSKSSVRGQRHLKTVGGDENGVRTKKLRTKSRRRSVQVTKKLDSQPELSKRSAELEKSSKKEEGLDQSLNDRETIKFDKEQTFGESNRLQESMKFSPKSSQRTQAGALAKTAHSTRCQSLSTIDMERYSRIQRDAYEQFREQRMSLMKSLLESRPRIDPVSVYNGGQSLQSLNHTHAVRHVVPVQPVPCYRPVAYGPMPVHTQCYAMAPMHVSQPGFVGMSVANPANLMAGTWNKYQQVTPLKMKFRNSQN